MKSLTLEKQAIIEKYTEKYKDYLSSLSLEKIQMEYISGLNRMHRSDAKFLNYFKYDIKVGDICYIDFGHAYTYEAGFQHFGIIMNIVGNKVFVVPMTSNKQTYKKADPRNAYPIKTLFQMGDVPGLHRQSVCFLHDAKFINKARIINVKAHVAVESDLFKRLKQQLLSIIT